MNSRRSAMSGSTGDGPVGGKMGIPARNLDDAILERELRQMWRTREDTVVNGGAHAIRAHTDRMLELEHEYIARFPRETTAEPGRTRRGARRRVAS
ncbi:MAG: DUF6158 family protein [Actinomycetota bacterium]